MGDTPPEAYALAVLAAVTACGLGLYAFEVTGDPRVAVMHGGVAAVTSTIVVVGMVATSGRASRRRT